MLKRLVGFFIGLALCLLATLYERRQIAAERAAFRKGEAGTSAGPPRSDSEPLPLWRRVMARQMAVPKWLWLAFILIAISVLAGCAAGRSYSDPRPTVLIKNESLDQLSIYAYGQKLGVLFPNEERCFTLPSTSVDFNLIARPLAGGQVKYSPPLNSYQSWVWTLDRMRHLDGISPDLLSFRRCK